MKNYIVLLSVTKDIEVSIEADSEDAAKELVLQSYENGEIDGNENVELEILNID